MPLTPATETARVATERRRFAADVRAGLTRTQKALPPKWLYDAVGTQLFIDICALDEYYPPRAELEILRHSAAAIAAALPAGITLIELGSGDAVKTTTLLRALLAVQPDLVYRPLDISATAVDESTARLARELPDLEVQGLVADYEHGLHAIATCSPKCLAFLGSTIGNYATEEATAFLREIAAALGPDDRVLLGADLVKDPAVLVAAYHDAPGVTERFIRNLFTRINRELGGTFDQSAFAYRVRFDSKQACVTMELESLRAQTVQVAAIELEVDFSSGERVHIENSHKFTEASLDALTRHAGLVANARWFDSRRWFSLTRLCRA